MWRIITSETLQVLLFFEYYMKAIIGPFYRSLSTDLCDVDLGLLVALVQHGGWVVVHGGSESQSQHNIRTLYDKFKL